VHTATAIAAPAAANKNLHRCFTSALLIGLHVDLEGCDHSRRE